MHKYMCAKCRAS